MLRASALALIALLAGIPCSAQGWKVAGAGNVTCQQWVASNGDLQHEVLSWMAGFASADEIGRVSKGFPSRIDKLTNEFFRSKINSTCSDAQNPRVTMLVIIFGVLGTEPRVSDDLPKKSLERSRDR